MHFLICVSVDVTVNLNFIRLNLEICLFANYLKTIVHFSAKGQDLISNCTLYSKFLAFLQSLSSSLEREIYVYPIGKCSILNFNGGDANVFKIFVFDFIHRY